MLQQSSSFWRLEKSTNFSLIDPCRSSTGFPRIDIPPSCIVIPTYPPYDRVLYDRIFTGIFDNLTLSYCLLQIHKMTFCHKNRIVRKKMCRFVVDKNGPNLLTFRSFTFFLYNNRVLSNCQLSFFLSLFLT